MTLKNFLTGFGFVAIILTLMPFVAADYWWIRMFDFPHVQLTFLTALAILVYFIKFDFKNYRDYIFVSCLVLCFIYQLLKIYPYTAFADYTTKNATEKADKNISIFACNVLQKNKDYDKVIDEMKRYDADIMLFTETNSKWKRAISEKLPSDYNYKVEYPLNNTYGILLYSKLPLIKSEVKFLVSDSIPSIATKLRLASGDTIQVYAIHPTPPMPQENPKSTDRDAELMKIALDSRNNKLPVIVLGDFNDVPWSESTQLFNRVSGLLDIRKGRGLYNTYDAKNIILRWPLDHIFMSREFRVKSLEVGIDVSSDHFPIHANLSFEPNRADEQKLHPLTDTDLETAKKQIKKERREN